MNNFVDEYLTIGKNKWQTTVVNCFITGVLLGGALVAAFMYGLIG